MDLEKDWKHYPVIRLDMSIAGANAESIRGYLSESFKVYEQEYGLTPANENLLERPLATGRIDVVVTTQNYIYVMELKLAKNGGLVAAEKQIKDNQYMSPFQADKRGVIALAVELDDMGKGLIGRR